MRDVTSNKFSPRFPSSGCSKKEKKNARVDVAIINSKHGSVGQQQPKHQSRGCERWWMLFIICCHFCPPHPRSRQPKLLWKGSRRTGWEMNWSSVCFVIFFTTRRTNSIKHVVSSEVIPNFHLWRLAVGSTVAWWVIPDSPSTRNPKYSFSHFVRFLRSGHVTENDCTWRFLLLMKTGWPYCSVLMSGPLWRNKILREGVTQQLIRSIPKLTHEGQTLPASSAL